MASSWNVLKCFPTSVFVSASDNCQDQHKDHIVRFYLAEYTSRSCIALSECASIKFLYRVDVWPYFYRPGVQSYPIIAHSLSITHSSHSNRFQL